MKCGKFVLESFVMFRVLLTILILSHRWQVFINWCICNQSLTRLVRSTSTSV